jgi:Domain of unknown function (DUF4194)
MSEQAQPQFSDVFGDLFPTEQTEPEAQFDPAALFASSAPPGAVLDGGERKPRFDGDTSELPPEVCWTLQELVAAPHVTDKARRHWAVVLQYEDVLRSRLSELGLALELSHEHRYAFTRQAEDTSQNGRTILRTKTLSLAASTLALYLYQLYLISPEEPVVEAADMVDHMMAYKPATDTDEAAFQKKIRTAIGALDDAAIIRPVKGSPDRYVISSVITSMLTADRIDALDQRYRAITRGELAVDVEQEEPGADV